ncbi:MAG: endonuclease domain-containing protein [Proteobacteria bacterium]|nr:endonuclease domain-containing protein [Pseudomonadota bacterium]
MRKAERLSRPHVKTLRRNMTEAEVMLWPSLRQKKHHGVHFRRQHPIGPYIADFACVSARLVVEVDGATHSTDEEVAYDRRRDAFMMRRGWRVIRVTNDEIYRHLDMVHSMIFSHLELPPPPSRGRCQTRAIARG